MGSKTDYEVIIAGGSFAGLSAALALGRSMRNVLIIDSGNPCNKTTPHAHNFITQDGAVPSDIHVLTKVQVLRYPTITFLSDKIVSGKKDERGFVVETENGDQYSAEKILIATGVCDKLPAISGLAECWGISALFCPYCHGYEARHQKTGILANGETGYRMAQIISSLSEEVILFTNGKASFSKEQKNKLSQHKVIINEKVIDHLEHSSGVLHTIVFKDSSKEKISVLYVDTEVRQSCDLAEKLGCKLTQSGLILVDENQRTSVKGILASGDATTHGRSISIAVATGTVAGITINGDLIAENW